MNRMILFSEQNWQLVQINKLSYFKNGKANMHVKTWYHIEHTNPEVNTGIFNIQTKRDALKEWKSFKKSGFSILNGNPLNKETL